MSIIHEHPTKVMVYVGYHNKQVIKLLELNIEQK
jgi:hypothetical protein